MKTNLRAVTTLIFDLDQTLIDRTQTYRSFLQGQFERFRNRLPAIEAIQFITAAQSYDNNGYTDKQKVYGNLIHDLQVTGVSVSELYDDYRSQYGFSPILLPGVPATLKLLRNQYKLGLITNGRSRSQRAKIERSGIAPFFEAVVISEEAGVKKPDSLIFTYCLERLGVTAEECAYIGDHPNNDIMPASGLNMVPIWIRTDLYAPPDVPHSSVKSIQELPGLLAASHDD